MTSGSSQLMTAMAVNTNNLANASTTGFRQDLIKVSSEAVTGPGLPTRIYAQAKSGGVDFTNGPIKQTGNSLDIAIKGDGWIAVQNEEGKEGYTRAGDLRVSAEGLLTNGVGHKVIGNNSGPIAIPPAKKINIADDGTISILPLGQQNTNMVVIDRIKLTKPEENQMVKGNAGMMYLKNEGEVAPPDANVKIVSGALEGSNVSTITTLVNMIQYQRQYEIQNKMMKNIKENDTQSSQLLRPF
jgi:flagellar basal-body rod protein FlgF